MNTIITNNRPRIAAGREIASIALFALVLLVLSDGHHALQFLKNAAPGDHNAGSIQFTDGLTFLNNLRGGLLGLGMPGAGVGFTASGLLWFTGSRFARTLAGAVAGGFLLVLFTPAIIE